MDPQGEMDPVKDIDFDKEIDSLLFSPEEEDGNVEYKRFLLNPTPARLERLCTLLHSDL